MKKAHDQQVLSRENNRILISFLTGMIFLVWAMLVARNGNALIFLVPPALILLFILFISIDKFLIITVFLVPLSVQLRFLVPDPPADIFLPTEIMLSGILVLMVFKTFISGETDRRILFHPVSVLIWLILGWSFVTSVTSTMTLVSFKALATKIWFIAGFYLLAANIFRKPSMIRNYFFAFVAGMTPVVILFIIRMWQSGLFNQAAAYTAPRPFFVDHTAIGAALAFCIPVIIYYLLRKETPAMTRRILGAVLILFTVAFILSYSRAAWLSMAVAAIVAVILLLKISWKIIVPLTITGIIILTTSWTDIIIRLNENRQESSADIARHLQSIANIRTDASNMERVNRWKAAIRMSAERPFLGWGPGTYQFKYAPYQVSTDKTIISTNYGEGGNAHSEYLGALVDSGIPGLILYIVFICIFVSRGIFIWKHHEHRSIRMLALALVAGLVTYIIHGGLNNFLDSDKISALFWGMIAAIVALDIAMLEKISSGSDSQVGSDN